MRRIQEGIAAILVAIENRLTFNHLNVAKRSVKPAIFRFSTACLALFLITTISSLLTPNSNSLLPTIQGQGSDNETAPADNISPAGDTTPPDITVPDDITVDAISPNGTPVQYPVTAEDDIDGIAIQDGSTFAQGGVGGNVTIACDPPSGFEFPIGSTTVECIATDVSDNEGEGSFTITVEEPVVKPPVVTKSMTAEIVSNGILAVAPAAFEFQANAIGGTRPYTYSWNFDSDGSEESDEETVEHTFEESGIHNVVLSITDSDGLTASDGIAIIVLGVPSGGWIIPLVVLASVVIGGIALGKYKLNQRSSRRIKIPPSALVEIKTKGGIDQ